MSFISKFKKNITSDVSAAINDSDKDSDISSKIVAVTESITKVIKKYTLIPIEKIISGVVGFMIAIFVGPALVVLGIIAVVRVFNNYVLNRYVWITEAAIGAFFLIVGTVLVKLATKTDKQG